MILEAKSLPDAIKQLQQLRSYQPYKFGGKWFIGYWGGHTRAMRSRQSLIKAFQKLGATSIETAILSSGETKCTPR